MTKKMNRYKVYLMVPYLCWEDVIAETDDDAINQCIIDGENIDYNEHEKNYILCRVN